LWLFERFGLSAEFSGASDAADECIEAFDERGSAEGAARPAAIPQGNSAGIDYVHRHTELALEYMWALRAAAGAARWNGV
jgi:hypothetical protein